MHSHNLEEWQHSHDFSVDHSQAEKQTKLVLLLTAVTMIAEIVAGTIFGSMALLADGWHMATHVGAFVITIFAYQYTRNHANNPRYTFGTGKVSTLGGFASAITLAVIAFFMAFESLMRFFQPHIIHFNQAIYVTIIGLVVNLISALLLQDHHHHGHEHHHPHEHHEDYDHHGHHDHNLHAAYIHVLADALTSVLAIIALLSGKFLGLIWLDPVMGLVGALFIAKWSYGLICETSLLLLDGGVDKQVKLAIMTAIEEDRDNRITDLHIWNLSQNHLATTISLITHEPQQPEYYKNLLKDIPSLSHIIVEVNHCQEKDCSRLTELS